jgi:hypothetical protein
MTDGHSTSLSRNEALMWGLRPDFYYCQTVAGLLMWGALSEERTGLSFPIAAGLGPRIYIPQEQGGIIITPCTGFHFRRLL